MPATVRSGSSTTGINAMRTLLGIALVVVIGVAAAFAFGFLDLDASGGKLPEIRAEAGKLPNVDVKTGSIDMGTRNETITVPTVEVKKADER
jgi:hypothetical protein